MSCLVRSEAGVLVNKQEIEAILVDLRRADDFPIARVVEALEKLDVYALGLASAWSDFCHQAAIAAVMVEQRAKEMP